MVRSSDLHPLLCNTSNFPSCLTETLAYTLIWQLAGEKCLPIFFILSHTFALKDSCRLFDQILKCMQWKVQHKCMIVGSCKIKAVLMLHHILTQCRDEWPLGPERPRGKCHSWPLCTLCTSNQHTSQMSSQEDFWLNNFKWNFINVPELRKNIHIRCTLSQSKLNEKAY